MLEGCSGALLSETLSLPSGMVFQQPDIPPERDGVTVGQGTGNIHLICP